MRACAKMRCGQEPIATISLGYAERRVVVADLLPERDPNLLDLCREHVERMTPPIGWTLEDRRTPVPLAV
ncbi:MAG TPA: DUF3499 family protein [Actinomycetota bacterium]|nr:DUF3499 family protein [Actinomycetota bacterium]